MSDKILVMYMRPCPGVRAAKRVLEEINISYEEINIDYDKEAAQRVEAWTRFRSVPTLIVATSGEVMPMEDPEPLEAGQSPRGVDRGCMITEPSEWQLKDWLKKHGFMD